jgi:beta-N-acetylhexosaminidase
MQRTAVVLACLLACAGCSQVVHPARPAESLETSPPSGTPTVSPIVTPAAAKKPLPSCVASVFARLSVRQRVGQLFMLGLANDQLGPNEIEAIRRDRFGSVWFTEKSSAGTTRIRGVSLSAQNLAALTGGIEFFVAANQEGGEIQSLTGPGFSAIPAADQQGRITARMLQIDAERWGRELAAAGVNFDFAPVFDVVPAGTEAANKPIGALHREFGSNNQTVAGHGLAFVHGMMRAGIVTSAKHFPGLGRVQGNTDDVSNVVDNVTTLGGSDLFPFQQAIDGGVPFVMVALATYSRIDPSHLAALSPIVLQQVLRNRLHFRGVILSDDLGATAAVKDIPAGERALEFLSAGGDMIIAKTISSAVPMSDAIVSRMKADPSFSSRVNDAVLHVLKSKQAARLLPCA